MKALSSLNRFQMTADWEEPIQRVKEAISRLPQSPCWSCFLHPTAECCTYHSCCFLWYRTSSQEQLFDSNVLNMFVPNFIKVCHGTLTEKFYFFSQMFYLFCFVFQTNLILQPPPTLSPHCRHLLSAAHHRCAHHALLKTCLVLFFYL